MEVIFINDILASHRRQTETKNDSKINYFYSSLFFDVFVIIYILMFGLWLTFLAHAQDVISPVHNPTNDAYLNIKYSGNEVYKDKIICLRIHTNGAVLKICDACLECPIGINEKGELNYETCPIGFYVKLISRLESNGKWSIKGCFCDSKLTGWTPVKVKDVSVPSPLFQSMGCEGIWELEEEKWVLLNIPSNQTVAIGQDAQAGLFIRVTRSPPDKRDAVPFHVLMEADAPDVLKGTHLTEVGDILDNSLVFFSRNHEK